MSAARQPSRVGTVIAPTLWKQCVGFMIGSALFALGSAPGFVGWAGASAANVGYFVGAWFFTGAGLIQLMMSGEPTARTADGHTTGIRAVWLSASTQSIGTLLFNVSTTSALTAHTVVGQKDFVWSPDAGGSVAFLVSGALGILAFDRSTGPAMVLRRRVVVAAGQLRGLYRLRGVRDRRLPPGYREHPGHHGGVGRHVRRSAVLLRGVDGHAADGRPRPVIA